MVSAGLCAPLLRTRPVGRVFHSPALTAEHWRSPVKGKASAGARSLSTLRVHTDGICIRDEVRNSCLILSPCMRMSSWLIECFFASHSPATTLELGGGALIGW